MNIKEKTHKKFLEFFLETSQINRGQEFEMAFSEIQRSTGTASVTLKRALNKLVEDGIISMVPGRNSRYAKFTVLNAGGSTESESKNAVPEQPSFAAKEPRGEIDLLKRQVRSQEIAISLLQDRLANLEEKLGL